VIGGGRTSSKGGDKEKGGGEEEEGDQPGGRIHLSLNNQVVLKIREFHDGQQSIPTAVGKS